MWIEKHGKTWRIREQIGTEKYTIKGGYRTKSEANAAAVLLEADDLNGTALVRRGGEQSTAAWVEQWWEDRSITIAKVRTAESTRGLLDRYVIPMLGHIDLGDLTPRDVQRWVNDLRTGTSRGRALAPKTVRNVHGLLAQVLADAVHARLIPANPTARTNLPPDVSTEMRFLTPPEAGRLVAATPEHWRPLVLFFLGTGCRWGEAIGLRGRHLDLLGKRATIVINTQEVSGRLVDEEPKSRRSRRTISLPMPTCEALAAVADAGRDERVFRGPKGGQISRKRFYPVWWATRDAIGAPELRIHDLRHTHAAWLISAGVPLTAVSRRLGHASITVTSDRYGHLLDEVDDRLIGAANKALGMIDMGGFWGERQPTPADSSRLDQTLSQVTGGGT